MKKLLLFTASLFFLACSSDDNNGPDGPQELQIKKFTSISKDANGNPTGDSTEYFFDENGTFTQKKIVVFTFNDTQITNYTYNELGQLTEAKTTYPGFNGLKVLGYNYDANNILDNITDSYDGSNPDIYYQLTRESNKINVTHRPAGFYTTLNYNNNMLTSTDQLGDGGGHSTENLVYDSTNNITRRSKISNGGIYGDPDYYFNYTYQYDTKINPLYPYFSEQPLNLLGENFFNLDYRTLFFSSNNFTSEVYTNTLYPEENYTLSRTFQYNEAGYPISALVKKDDVLIEELTYDYY